MKDKDISKVFNVSVELTNEQVILIEDDVKDGGIDMSKYEVWITMSIKNPEEINKEFKFNLHIRKDFNTNK